jgi:hypothetical protein
MTTPTHDQQILKFLRNNPNSTCYEIAKDIYPHKKGKTPKQLKQNIVCWGYSRLASMEAEGLVTRNRSTTEHKWSAVAKITECEREILACLKENPGATQKELLGWTSCPTSKQVRLALVHLRGSVKKVGENYYLKGHNLDMDDLVVNHTPKEETPSDTPTPQLTKTPKPLAFLKGDSADMFKAVCLLRGKDPNEVLDNAMQEHIHNTMRNMPTEAYFRAVCTAQGQDASSVLSSIVEGIVNIAKDKITD